MIFFYTCLHFPFFGLIFQKSQSIQKGISQVQWLRTVIPATQEAETRRLTVPGLAGQNVSKIPSQPILGMVAHAGHGGLCL
jgi:hypothetical protein